ncbi:MAG TPA: Lrp/AsnC family transcriptional regulator [Vitreimonas sp.]|uniref:Lrp/AsnC family transcriptional regulator n=1 Tax=Vitreimonas sp. TaxID=3069702 RepID=UPI002D342233|nr:Lrp/AsnC family transcriptional regulator [Vitreimonas sp.]HYD88014.1 Lrp/AsnC family transcriptional regulator [Vitreimonas sp.]
MKREPIDLDHADRRLLRAIQRDASASQAELAEEAGVSPSLVSRRLSRLKEAGVLRAVVGLVDPEGAGLTCSAIIRVRLRDHAAANVKAFKDLVARMNEVTLCVMLTGEADYLMKIVARDLPHFQEIVQSKLLRCAAIAHMESSIVLEHLKNTTELPLDDAS